MIRSNNESPLAAAQSTLGPPSGELVLRVRDGHDAARELRLATNKCSIGSASDCSVQLSQPGIQPIHCVILRGKGKTVVRRWAADTWLNEKHFVDAELKPGDSLRIRNVQIDVFFPEDPTPTPIPFLAGATGPPRINDDIGRVEVLLERLQQTEARVRDLQSHFQANHSSDSQISSRVQRVERLLRSDTTRRFQRIFSQLKREKTELERRLAAQRLRHKQERNFWKADADRLAAELARQSDRMRYEQQRNRQAEKKLVELQANSNIDLASRLAQITAAEESVAKQQAKVDAALAAIEARRASEQDKFARRAAELDNQQQALNKANEELQCNLAELNVQREATDNAQAQAERIAELESLLADRDRQMEEVNNELAKCHTELESQTAEFKQRQLTLEAESADLKKQLAAMEKERQDLQAQAEQLTSQLQAAEAYQRESTEQLNRICELENELEQGASEWQTRETELLLTVRRLEEELEVISQESTTTEAQSGEGIDHRIEIAENDIDAIDEITPNDEAPTDLDPASEFDFAEAENEVLSEEDASDRHETESLSENLAEEITPSGEAPAAVSFPDATAANEFTTEVSSAAQWEVENESFRDDHGDKDHTEVAAETTGLADAMLAELSAESDAANSSQPDGSIQIESDVDRSQSDDFAADLEPALVDNSLEDARPNFDDTETGLGDEGEGDASDAESLDDSAFDVVPDETPTWDIADECPNTTNWVDAVESSSRQFDEIDPENDAVSEPADLNYNSAPIEAAWHDSPVEHAESQCEQVGPEPAFDTREFGDETPASEHDPFSIAMSSFDVDTNVNEEHSAPDNDSFDTGESDNVGDSSGDEDSPAAPDTTIGQSQQRFLDNGSEDSAAEFAGDQPNLAPTDATDATEEDLLARIRSLVDPSSTPSTGEPADAWPLEGDEPDSDNSTDAWSTETTFAAEQETAQPADEVALDSPHDVEAASAEEILARMGHQMEQPREAPDDSSEEPHELTEDKLGGSTLLSASQDSDDDSIEDYMQRLLQRVGSSPDMPATLGGKEMEQPTAVMSDDGGATSPTSQRPLTKTTNMFSNSNPNRERPKTVVDLEAIREIANASTRSALTRHDKKSTDRQAISKLAAALIALLTAAILIILSRGQMSVFFISGIAAAVIAACFMYSAFKAGAASVLLSVTGGRLSTAEKEEKKKKDERKESSALMATTAALPERPDSEQWAGYTQLENNQADTSGDPSEAGQEGDLLIRPDLQPLAKTDAEAAGERVGGDQETAQ